MSAVMTLEQKATTKHVAATTIVMYHLNILDQFLGFSGSPSANVTSLYSFRVSPFGVLFALSIMLTDRGLTVKHYTTDSSL